MFNKKVFSFYKKAVSLLLAFVFLFNISAQALVPSQLVSSEVEEDLEEILSEEYSKKAFDPTGEALRECLEKGNNNKCKEYILAIKNLFTDTRNKIENGKDGKEENYKPLSQKGNTTLEDKKSYKEYAAEYQTAIEKEYKKAEEEIEQSYREALLLSNLTWEEINHLSYLQKKQKTELKEWKENEEKKIKANYSKYEKEFKAWQEKAALSQEEAGKKYLKKEAKKIISVYQATSSKEVKITARELLVILLNSEEKPGDFIENRQITREILLESLENNPCAYTKGSKTLTKEGADKYIGYDKPGIYPTLNQEDWKIIEAKYKDEKACQNAFTSLEGLSFLQGTPQAIAKVAKFIEETETGLAASDSLIISSAVLLKWKAYQTIQKYLKKQFVRENNNGGQGIGGFGAISESLAYNGKYLGEVSVWTQREDGTNAWEDMASLLAKEGSAQSKEMLKSALSSCKVFGGKDKLECQTIMPFLYGAVLYAPKVINEAKPYQEAIPQNLEYFDKQGRIRQVDVEGIKRRNIYTERIFREKMKIYGDDLSSGLAGFLYALKFSDLPVESKMLLDNKLAEVYTNIKAYSKGSARYNKLKTGRIVVAIFRNVGIAVDVWFTLSLVGLAAKGTFGARALVKARNLLKGKSALSVAQRATILRQVAFIKEGSKLRRFGRNFTAGLISSANIGRKINASAYLAEKNGMSKINYMLHNIAYRRGGNIALKKNILRVEGLESAEYFKSSHYIPGVHQDIFRVSRDVRRAGKIGISELGEGGKVVSYVDKVKMRTFADYTQDYLKGVEEATKSGETVKTTKTLMAGQTTLLPREFLYSKEYKPILPFVQDEAFSKIFKLSEKVYKGLMEDGKYVVNIKTGEVFKDLRFHFDGYLSKNNLLGGLITPTKKLAKSTGVSSGAKASAQEGIFEAMDASSGQFILARAKPLTSLTKGAPLPVLKKLAVNINILPKIAIPALFSKNIFNIKMPAQISDGQMDKMAFMQGRVPAFNNAKEDLSNVKNIQAEALGVYNYNNDPEITYIPNEPLPTLSYNVDSPKKMAAVEIANKIISDLLIFSSNISTKKQALVYNRLLKEIYTLEQPSIDDPMLKINKIWEEASWYIAQKPLVVFLGEGTTPIRPNHIKEDAFFSYPLDRQKDYKAFIADKVKRLSSVLDEYTIYVQIHGERNNILKLDKERNVSLSEILDIIEANKGEATVNVVSASCHGGSALGDALNRDKINVLLLSGLNDVCVIGDINFVSVNDLRSSYIEAIKNKHYGATLIYEGKVFNSLSDGAASELACPYLKEEINNLHSIYFKDDLIGKDLFNLFVKFPKYKAEFYPFDKIKSLKTIPPVFNPLGNLKDFATLIFPPTKIRKAWLYSLVKLDSKGKEISSEDLFFEEVGNETSSFLFDNSLEKLKQTFPKWEYKPLFDYDAKIPIYNTPVNSNPQQNLLDKPLSAVKNNSSDGLSAGAVKKLNIYKEQTKLDTQKLALIKKINKNIDNLNTLDITKLSAKKQAVYKDIKQKIETLLSKNTKPNITELKRLETLTALLNIEKPFLVLQGAKSDFKIPFNFSDIRILDLSKEKNYKKIIAEEIRSYASVFDNFPVYLSTHGFIEGSLFISKLKGPKIVNSNLLEIANIIKENKLNSKVDLISGACHSGAGFTPELLNTNLNILLFTGANDVCVNTTNMGFIEYNNLPNTYLNAVSEGYYGATLIYEGKIYNPLELGLKAAKNNKTLTKELEVLKKIYSDADITGTNLGKDVYNLLSNFRNYKSNHFIGEKFFYFPKIPFIFNPVINPEFMAKSLIKRTNDERWVYFLRIFDDKEKLVFQKGTSFAEPKEKTLNFLFKTSKKALEPVFKNIQEKTEIENIVSNINFFKDNPDYLRKYQVIKSPKSIEDLENLNLTLGKGNVVYRGVSVSPQLLEQFLTKGFNIDYVNNNGSSIDVPYDNFIYFASKKGSGIISTPKGDIPKYKLGGAQEAAFYAFSNLYNQKIKIAWQKQGFEYKVSPEQNYALLLELKADPKYIDKPSWQTHFHPAARRDVPSSLITKAWLLLDEKTAVALHKPLNIAAESQIAPGKKFELISYSKKKENISYKETAFKKNFNFLETEKSFLGIPVFKIQTIRGSTHNIGTGFYLKYRNFPFILTAAHVVEGNTLPYVTLFNDNGFSAKTKILSISEKSDLAVLSVPKGKLDFAEPWTLALKEPQIGDKLVSVGFPGSNSKKISEVSLLKTKEELNNNIFYLHDRDNLSYGASGSPLSVDKYSSKIYGVVAAADIEKNIAASVPLPQVRTFLGETIKKILFTPELNKKFIPLYPAFSKNYENVLNKYTKFKKYPKQEAVNLQNSQDRVMPLISKVSNHYPTDWRNVKLIGSGDKKIFNSFTHNFEVPSKNKINRVFLYEVDEGLKGESGFINTAYPGANNISSDNSLFSANFNFLDKLKFLTSPVFKIKVFRGPDAVKKRATGFYVKYRNFPFILTVGHLFKDADLSNIRVYNNLGFSEKAELLNLSDKSDLAILALPQGVLDRFNPWTLALKEPRVGDDLISIGYPEAKIKKTTKVELLSRDMYLPSMNRNGTIFYQHEAGKLCPGTSGSPLSNIAAPKELVGVSCAVNPKESKAVSVPLPQVRTFLGETIKKILFTPELNKKFLPLYPAFAKNYENVLNKYNLFNLASLTNKPVSLPPHIKNPAFNDIEKRIGSILYRNSQIYRIKLNETDIVWIENNISKNPKHRDLFWLLDDQKGKGENTLDYYATFFDQFIDAPDIPQNVNRILMLIVGKYWAHYKHWVRYYQDKHNQAQHYLDERWLEKAYTDKGLKGPDNYISTVYTGENAEKPLNLKTDIKEEVALDPRVGKLVGFDDEIKAYYKKILETLKGTQQDETRRTKLFDTLVEKFAPKYSLIGIEYPKVLSTNLSDLPNEISKIIGHKHYRTFIMTAVDTSGWFFDEKASKALTALKDKPITNEEWAQVVGLFTDLNEAGFYHNDLLYNLFFRRDNNGKLILTIIDFEYFDNTKDMKDLNIISMQLESIGAKEKNALKNTNNQYLFNLPSWVLPAVGVGLLAFSLANPASAAFALAAVPLMSHNIKLTAAPKQKGISAKTLFTKKYKNNLFTKDYEKVIFFHRDIGRVMPYLPSDFIENKAIYRGMTLEKYEDLKRIFVKGLEVSKSSHDYIFFSREVNVAIDYSTQYNWGHLPVIIKKHNYSKLDHNYNDFGHIVRYSRNIPYKNIDDVLVWAQLDGKLGWWRASLDENGEVILQPTDNMQTVK